VDAYQILNTWLGTDTSHWRPEPLGPAAKDFAVAKANVLSGQSTLIDGHDVLDYTGTSAESGRAAEMEQFLRMMEPVVSPWDAFVVTGMLNPTTSLLLACTALSAKHSALVPHPSYHETANILVSIYSGKRGSFMLMGRGAISNYSQRRVVDRRAWFDAPTTNVHVGTDSLLPPEAGDPTPLLRVGMFWLCRLLTFSLVRNHRFEAVPMSRAEQRRATLPPTIRFTRLTIDPMRPARRSTPAAETPHNTPWHQVRGHFVTYRPEAPMFGRPGQHGTYWIPAHERGDREHGEVHKDYRVATGDGAVCTDTLGA
jgi:hypothetical protein